MRTPFKKYRRDVRRYLMRERETHPTEPRGYFELLRAQIKLHIGMASPPIHSDRLSPVSA